MRTRFHNPVSHATLLNHYGWASRRNHGREMRKVREEKETLKLTLKIKQAMAILSLFPFLAMGQGITTIRVPEGAQVVIVRESTNAVTNALVVAPPRPPPTPLSVQMAAQLAKGKAAPWTQRFIVTKVEESALTRVEDDNEPPVFSTNYTITVVPVPDGTNAPTVWGAATSPSRTGKSKALKFVTTRPTKKGDEYDFFPTQ